MCETISHERTNRCVRFLSHSKDCSQIYSFNPFFVSSQTRYIFTRTLFFSCTLVLMFRSNTNSINVIILIFYSCFFLSSLVLDSERTNTTTERLSNSFSINALNEILSINFVHDYYLSLAPLLRPLNPTKVVRKKFERE